MGDDVENLAAQKATDYDDDDEEEDEDNDENNDDDEDEDYLAVQKARPAGRKRKRSEAAAPRLTNAVPAGFSSSNYEDNDP